MAGRRDISKQVERLIRPYLRSLQAYSVPSSQGMVKLDAMENPFQLPEQLLEPWLAAIAKIPLNRYPDAGADSLKAQLQQTMAVPEDAELILGNGSDELIQLLCTAIVDAPYCKGKPAVIMAPEPGFVMYRLLANAVGAEYVGVPLNSRDYSLDLNLMLTAIDKHEPAIIFLAYPNNPTGNLFHDSVMEQIIDKAPGIVVVDEAYQPFAGRTFMPYLQKYDNLLVMRTLSKLGLAGIRLGYMAGRPEWINEFDKLRLPYNINALTQLTAEFACRHFDVFLQQAAIVRQERQRLYESLLNNRYVRPYPSDANFILFQLLSAQADAVFTQLKEQGILIKNLSANALLKNCLRVTVGSTEENKRFLSALQNCFPN